ncbi:hypothetical protein [Lysobacter gummosus]|uniref:hypothetical protein n=1 Tax=Lysobacter gummosus TaxID=262324 RepID=UPI00362BEE43
MGARGVLVGSRALTPTPLPRAGEGLKAWPTSARKRLQEAGSSFPRTRESRKTGPSFPRSRE